jgi:hypothetical protein
MCVCERLDIPIPSISMSSIPIYLSCICLYVIICLCRSIKVSHQQKATASSRRPGCALPKNRCSRARHRHLWASRVVQYNLRRTKKKGQITTPGLVAEHGKSWTWEATTFRLDAKEIVRTIPQEWQACRSIRTGCNLKPVADPLFPHCQLKFVPSCAARTSSELMPWNHQPNGYIYI